MEIYPRAQAQMFFAAFLLGVGAGLLHHLLLALRTVLGAYLPSEHMRTVYERPVPLLQRSAGFPKSHQRRVWRFFVAFTGDLLFCLSCTVALILLLYDYNCGAWRISVLVLFLLGLALFRFITERLFAWMNDWLAYGLSVLFLYVRALLCLPLRGIAFLAKRFVLCPIKNGVRKLWQKHRARVSKRLCQAQLALALRGLILQERKMTDVKQENHAPAMDH